MLGLFRKRSLTRGFDGRIPVISLRDRMILSVATAAHAAWLTDYRATNGNVPRMKKTKDEAWVKAHGTDQVDIAIDYALLPSDWQEENRLGAEAAVNLVLSAVGDRTALNDVFIEAASESVHTKWLERNSGWATEVQKLPYAALPEEEKEKDRFFVRAAIAAYCAG